VNELFPELKSDEYFPNMPTMLDVFPVPGIDPEILKFTVDC